jgi:hypothetical protein
MAKELVEGITNWLEAIFGLCNEGLDIRNELRCFY